jgi:hypothetical protein
MWHWVCSSRASTTTLLEQPMKTHLALSALLMIIASATGCAASSDEESAPQGDPAGSEEDLTARQLPGVAAVEIAEVRQRDTVLSSKTLGAPAKVKKVVAAIKKLRPSDPVPRCMERDTTRLTFLDATGKKVATVDTYCSGFGGIEFADGKPGYGVKFSTESVKAEADAPFAVGDAVWGVTTIEITKPGRNESKTLTGDKVKPVLDGLKLDEVPDPNASFPRCLPSHAVTFKRADAKVATTSFLCGADADPPASIKASFVGLDPKNDQNILGRGGITLDPRPVIRAMASSN